VTVGSSNLHLTRTHVMCCGQERSPYWGRWPFAIMHWSKYASLLNSRELALA